MKSALNDDAEVYAVDAAADLRTAAAKKPGILSLPVSLVVSVGATTLTIDELLSLNSESILKLDAAIDDPVSLLMGDRVVARGELVETEADPPGLGVRIISVSADETDRS
ncbi:MAG: FliM/FliN family flagellar motor switch protein [Parvularculaceae bacterium]|nr:FliM/FliN family flagellar motor switch protein [Parvularculaceae bacterium]